MQPGVGRFGVVDGLVAQVGLLRDSVEGLNVRPYQALPEEHRFVLEWVAARGVVCARRVRRRRLQRLLREPCDHLPLVEHHRALAAAEKALARDDAHEHGGARQPRPRAERRLAHGHAAIGQRELGAELQGQLEGASVQGDRRLLRARGLCE